MHHLDFKAIDASLFIERASISKLLMQLNAVARRGTPWVKQHGNSSLSIQAGTA